MREKVAFYTLGCKVNQYETEALIELFREKGFEIVDFNDVADIYIINTCTVTGRSDSKSKQLIRRANRQNPDAIIGVIGCYPQVAAEEVLAMEGVSFILGTKNKTKILDVVERFKREGEKINAIEDIRDVKEFEEMKIKGHENKTRAFIKIQDGCNQFCSYCIIPYARGPVRSRNIKEIVEEVKRVADEGFKEVVLTGIHIASYGKDLESLSLKDVIYEISKIEGVKRIRLSSIEPTALTEDFIKFLSANPKICRHFHVSLQSGCDETLKRMNRKYTTKEYKEIINNLRFHIPGVAISTDIMVGFPGETDEEFKKTYKFVEEIAFSHIHVFKYSPRKGTPAATFKNQINPQVKEVRSRALIELGNSLKREFNSKFIGATMEVLYETKISEDLYEGLTDNYIKVVATSKEDVRNRLMDTQMIDLKDDYLIGKIL